MGIGGACSVEGCKRTQMYNSPVCYKHKGMKTNADDLWWTEEDESDGLGVSSEAARPLFSAPKIVRISEEDTKSLRLIFLSLLTGYIGVKETFSFLSDWYEKYLERRGPCTSTMGCYDELFLPLILLAISCLSFFFWGAVGDSLLRFISRSRSA